MRPRPTIPTRSKVHPGLTAFLPLARAAARVIRALKAWESTGTTGVNFLLNVLETIPQEEVLASLRIFGKEVMPHFKEAA